MIYISRVILENFQSHEYTDIEFESGLNVILGKSDSGKTSILRAIKWALYNEPSGDYFLRKSKSEVAVTVIFNNETVVKRFRTKSKNSYYLKNSLGEEYTFEGFGINVPQEIVDATGMLKINIDSKNQSIINLAEQLEGPYLLNETNSVKASAIGRLVNVNFLDDALVQTSRDMKRLDSEGNKCEQDKITIEEELKKYEYLFGYEQRLRSIKALRAKIEEKSRHVERLKIIKGKYEDSRKEIIINREINSKYKNINEIEKIYNALNKTWASYKELKKLKIDYDIKYTERTYNEKQLKKLENTEKLETVYVKVEEDLKYLAKTKTISSRYVSTTNSIKNEKNRVKNLVFTAQVEDNLLKLHKKVEKAKKLKDINKVYCKTAKSIAAGNSFLIKFANLNKVGEIKEKLVVINSGLCNLIKLEQDYKKQIQAKSLAQNTVKEARYLLDEKIEEYNKGLVELEICPLCLNNIGKDTIEHIREHYK